MLRRNLLVLCSLWLISCGEDGGGVGPGGGEPAPAPTLSTASSAPFSPITLSGLPADREDLVVEMFEPEVTRRAGGPVLVPLFDAGGGEYRIYAPLHPSTPVDGGSVSLRVLGDQFETLETSLELGSLQPAPGAFAALVDSLQGLLDARLASLGTTRSEVLEADWASDLPEELYTVAVAQTLVDDPSHEHDLRDLLAGSAAYQDLVGSTTLDFDLLDRVAAASGLAEIFGQQRAQLVGSDSLAKRRLAITTAAQLDAAMEEAWDAANEIDPNSATGELLTAYGTTLGVAGLVGGPVTGLAAAGMGFSLWAYQTYLDGKANLLPREFVPGSLDFDVDIEEFEEDRDGPGTWSNVRVSAQSLGWELDKAAVDIFLQLAGGARAYRSWLSRLTPEATNFFVDLGIFLSGTQTGNLQGGTQVVTIPPEVWSDIDITGDTWSESRVVGGDAIAIVGSTVYDPVKPGEALLTLSTRVSRFGGATPVEARRTIRVLAIEVEIFASATNVDPGDVVELQIEVRNAADTSLEWSLSAGSWTFGPTDLGGGTWSANVQTPSDAGEFPVQVVFRSTATGGARSAPDAPLRQDVLNISGEEVEVFVDPASKCLESGETQQFTAIVVGSDDTSVTWSVVDDGGNPVLAVSSTGLFTAPSASGTYTVIATSNADENAKAGATVEVGGCSCWWFFDVGGSNGGSFSGSFATHSYPNMPLPGPFSMSFSPDSEVGTGVSGVAVVINQLGPGPNATGTWAVVISFSDGATRSWVAGEQETTSAELTITSHEGGVVEGTISGTAVTPLGSAQAEYVPFALSFRSNDLFGETVCGQ